MVGKCWGRKMQQAGQKRPIQRSAGSNEAPLVDSCLFGAWEVRWKEEEICSNRNVFMEAAGGVTGLEHHLRPANPARNIPWSLGKQW